MSQDKLLKQRFEQKYLIRSDTARMLRDFVRCYLDFDEHSAIAADYSYRVDTLYLDSDDLKLHHAAVCQAANRYQLRLRYYSSDPEAPVFFEIKRHRR